MAVEENIFNYLTGKSDLTLYIGKRLGWIVLEAKQYPQVTYKRIDAPGQLDYDDEWQRWRFYVMSNDKFECQTISDIIQGHLHRAYGLIDGRYFDCIVKIDQSPPEKRADNIFEQYTDYRVCYH
jgi:hypothetical protein